MHEYHLLGRQAAQSVLMERRISLRLLGYWEKLRGQRPMPTEQELEPDDIRDLWDNCLFLQVKDIGNPDYSYTYIGKSILDAYHSNMPSHKDRDFTNSNMAFLTQHFNTILETRKPVLEEGEFYNEYNGLVEYRVCLLPFGSGDKVEAILGGLRFKLRPSLR